MEGQSEITFSIWKMFVKNKERGERWIPPTKDYFLETITKTKRIKSKFFKVEKIENDNYIFLIINSGNIEPRDDYIIDIDSKNERKNPRSETEVELIKQVFVYYDFSSDLLYISGVKYRKLFEEILGMKTDEILIKGVYEGEATFLKLIKSVDEISFKSEPNLFATVSNKRKTLYDFFETNELGDFTMDLKLKGIAKAKIINFLKSMFSEQKNQAVNSLTIRGKDESDFEYVYNSETFIKKIIINLDKQKNGKFNNKSVLQALRNKIKMINNEKVK